MSEYEIASLNLQEIMTWVTVAHTMTHFMMFCLIGYGIWTMNRSNNRQADATKALTERISHIDERRHKKAMAAHKKSMEARKAAREESMEAHKESMAAHKEAMAAHKADHKESMAANKAAHEESMTALKALIANGEKTSEALVELLRRTNPDAPAAPAAAN